MTSRRALIRGAAWSVPALTVATNAPAFAASSSNPAGLVLTLNSAAPTEFVYSAEYNFIYEVTNTGGSATTEPITLLIPHPANTTRQNTVSATGWIVTESGTTITATFGGPLAPGAMASVIIR